MPNAPIERVRALVHELRRRKVIQATGAYLVVAFVTLQLVDAAFDLIFSDPEAAGRLVLIALIVGFPIVVGFAWVFDVKPPRFIKESPTAPEEGQAPSSLSSEQLRRDSIAVLPFDNLSDDPSNSYFSDGITDDIITSIAHIRGVRVPSRASVARYKDAGRSVEEIASELNTATVVLGSVRRIDSRVRIVAQMIDATKDRHLWSETYDRDLEDIFQVQSEVAQGIADAVARELPAADRRSIELRGTTDPLAYDLYLRGRHLWNQRTESTLSEAIRYLQRAIEHDPGFALAHAALAEAYTVSLLYGVGSPRELVLRARASADAALGIDAGLGEALAAKACLTGAYDWDWAGAERTFADAVNLAPSYATAYQWYALNVLTPLGRFADATRQLDVAGDLDPGSAVIRASHGIIAFYARRYHDALGILQKVLEVHPDFGLAQYFLGLCWQETGEKKRAIDAHSIATRLTEDSSETLAALACASAAGGEDAGAEAILDRLHRRRERRYVSRALLSQVLIGLGRLDEALRELSLALEDRATDLIWIGVRPAYDPIREDPRFRSIIEEVRLG